MTSKLNPDTPMPKSKKLNITLTLTVTYDLRGAAPRELRDQLDNVADQLENVAIAAMNRGSATADGPAEVESWSVKVTSEELAASSQSCASDQSEKSPLDVDTFIDRLGAEGAESIIPEVYYRLLCQETDGDRLDEEGSCRLERSDNPAFRMGCNDYADQMQKDHQWVTFDNGGSYYTADDVKTAIAVFDGDEYELTPELRSIVEWWL
jgi:hypothetical protein